MKTYLTFDKQLRTETDTEIIANLERKGWISTPQPAFNPETQQCNWVDGEWVITPIPPTLYKAEQWLTKEGYGATQLVTLSDLYASLTAEGKSSEKLNAVKAWTNAVLGEYVQSSQSKENWGAAPFSFNETVIEAYQKLGITLS
jgi:hypothetical protein